MNRKTAAKRRCSRSSKGSKVYGGLHAIDGVDFELRAGEIHALLGENGAGKSTLCKAIAGAITLTSGDYLIDGSKVEFASPQEALEGGVAMVYQESSLVPSMTVAQNLELGMEKFFTVYSKINIAATQSLQSMNFNVDPLALVENLGTAKRQMVEIVRAVRHNAQVFIFDEPTASLTPEETQHLFHLLETLKERGAGIIFISHALEEALDIADRITVLRDGKLVSTVARQGHDARCAGAHDDRPRRYREPLRDARRRSGRAEAAVEARRKGALGRKRHHGRCRQEHVVFGLSTARSSASSDWSGPAAPRSRRSSAARASATSCAAA